MWYIFVNCCQAQVIDKEVFRAWPFTFHTNINSDNTIFWYGELTFMFAPLFISHLYPVNPGTFTIDGNGCRFHNEMWL